LHPPGRRYADGLPIHDHDVDHRALFRYRAALAVHSRLPPAVPLLFGSHFFGWSFASFLLWVFLLSISVLDDNLRRNAGSNYSRPGRHPSI
jgi:hypothetical protein